MGVYVNHPEMDKVKWLHFNASYSSLSEIKKLQPWNQRPVTQAAVCAMNSGMFVAAGIVCSDNELTRFTAEDDHRPKTWYLVDVEKLKEVVSSNELEFLKERWK